VHLNILGIRGNIETSAPGYVRHLVDDRLLLDIGKKQYRPQWIFTHLHGDHASLEPSDISKECLVYAPASLDRLCVSRFSSAAFMDAETALLFKEFSLGPEPVIEIVSLLSSPCLI